MDNVNKALSLFVIAILAVSNLIMVNSAYAQVSVDMPTMPSFGVMYEPHTYYVPPTYGVDPSTGQAVLSHEGYYKVNKFVILSISNQPFETYTDSGGNPIDLYYSVRWKPHKADSWEDLLPATARFSQNKDFDITAISIGFKGNDPSGWNIDVLDYIPGSKIDFQVQASIGYYTADNVFIGKTSGWSNTQTLTVDDSQTPTLTPNQEPQQPDLTIIMGLTILAVVLGASLGIGLLIYLIKRK